MVSIILEWNHETRRQALKSGFIEKTVLIKGEACLSTNKNKARLESEVRKMRPYQFLVADFWGMCDPD